MTVDYKTAPGWIRAEEREKLKQLAEAVPPNGCIINIGVEHGASIACLRAGNPTCHIIGIDIDLTTLDKETYLACKPLLVDGDSGSDEIIDKANNLVDTFGKSPFIQLLFVDGDHSYVGVLRDTAYCQGVEVGGIVVFHDCFDYLNPQSYRPNPNSPEVNTAVDEWFYNTNDRQSWIELDDVGTMRLFKRVR